MKHDWRLIKSILQRLADGGPETQVSSEDFAKRPAPIVAYHMQAMKEAGLIETAIAQRAEGSTVALATRLTWTGQVLLDTIR